MPWLVWLVAFLLGSIPTGHLVVYLTKGINIQKVGSGNIGSTNVGRVAGKGPALLTQGIDVGKGALATLLAMAWSRWYPAPFLVEGAALLVVAGNAFTPFLRFRGGKGVNTTAGAFLPLFPWAVVGAFLVHLAIRKITRYVSLASLVAGGVYVLLAGLLYHWRQDTLALGLAVSLVVWRHRQNIVRLFKGQESKEQR